MGTIELRIGRACRALEKGCCLELYYEDFSRLVEVHAVGFDVEERAVIQVWQPRPDVSGPGLAGWKLLRLDETRKVAVSGYFSEAPRSDFRLNPEIVRLVRVAGMPSSEEERAEGRIGTEATES